MSRKINRGERCDKCRMKDTHCICELLVPIDNVTPVTILMHYRENITTTNTGRIAHFLLKNSSVQYRGLIDSQLKEEDVISKEHTPLFLYPSENSITLTSDFISTLKKPAQLIVPDGSWRQARKVNKREPFLKDVQCVKLEDISNGIFYLRRKVKEEGVSTLEAIARALGTIESPTLQKKLEEVFKVMIEKTLDTRGKRLENYEQYR